MVGFILTMVACCAISLNFDVIMSTAFSSGYGASDNATFDGVKIGVGLRAAAIQFPTGNQSVWDFDQFCNVFEIDISLQEAQECGNCAESSTGIIGTLLFSLVVYFPTIFTDVTRMYSNYDVNCQKVFGSFVALASLASTLYTWRGYQEQCFSSFYDGIISYGVGGQILQPEQADQAVLNVDFQWKYGPGLICVVTATFLKIVDILCHFIVPTPSITRDRKEQAEYENI
jgi:hypothetical protein